MGLFVKPSSADEGVQLQSMLSRAQPLAQPPGQSPPCPLMLKPLPQPGLPCSQSNNPSPRIYPLLQARAGRMRAVACRSTINPWKKIEATWAYRKACAPTPPCACGPRCAGATACWTGQAGPQGTAMSTSGSSRCGDSAACMRGCGVPGNDGACATGDGPLQRIVPYLSQLHMPPCVSLGLAAGDSVLDLHQPTGRLPPLPLPFLAPARPGARAAPGGEAQLGWLSAARPTGMPLPDAWLPGMCFRCCNIAAERKAR